MMCALVALLALVAPNGNSATLQLPPPPVQSFDQKFPALPSSSTLDNLRDYRLELEFFRQRDLEGYNQSVEEYSKALAQFGTALEKARKENAIDNGEYADWSAKLGQALANCGRQGDLLKPYFLYLSRYQEKDKDVKHRIRLLELKGISF